MKKIFFILIAILMTNVARAEVSEDLKKQADEYAAMLEKDNWMLVPRQANFPKTISFMDMREDTNYFRLLDDKLDIQLDFAGTRVRHALSEEQLFWLAEENAELFYLLETAPPFFTATCSPTKKEVRISKNCKTVTMDLNCNLLETNFRDYNSMPSFTVRVDVKTGTAQITCHGMHYDESFDGNIYLVKEVK